ncbi:hypothetical protein GCM10023093_06630 [Nemorincola caseinilytica]|uniref:Gliding motility-associated C-terminal domain-containing protein n=1 Tax=Nemorincola caseinilytica TaxID=2054315 RepID=A0ABP8N5F9_9BACT
MTCPTNIDFELGDLSIWNYYIGSCCPSGVPSIGAAPVAPIACRHTLVNATGLVGCAGGATDPVGGFPILPPGGGSYAFRLGNNGTSAQAERATYFVNVPSSVSNYSLVYRYATVLQDPGHPAAQQPRFIVRAYDSATLAPIPCADYSYVVNASLPGFITVGSGSASIRYLPWSTGVIDLSGMGGSTVGIEFTTADCSQGGHYGYAYIDLSCGLFQVSTTACDTLTPPVLTAPPGFASYAWYDSATFSILYGTNDTLIVTPFPSSPTTIAVILTPYTGFGCPDTLYTTIKPAHLALHPSNDTAICLGRSTTLYPNATDVAIPLTYSWAPATGLSCTTCANPVASPTVTTAYTVTVTNTSSCTRTHVFNVSILPNVTTTVTVDTPTCNGYNNGSATVLPTSGTGPYVYSWSTAPPQSTATATGLTAGSYTVIVMDAKGCMDTNVAVLLNPAPRIISIATSTNPTTCGGADGTIVIGGMIVPDTTYTVSYKINGIPQTQVVTAGPTGQVTLNALIAGVYSDITIILAACPYNVIGPLTLVDPPAPDLGGVTSNSYVCEGDTLKLFASSATTGVSWSWEGPAGFISTLQNPMIYPATLANTGVYSVTVSKNNCFNYSSTYVEVRVRPIPSASSNAPVCSGDTLFLYSSSSNGATSYSWTGPGTYSSVDEDPYIAHVQTVSTGVYTVNVTLNGCTVPTTVNVVVNQTPDAPIGPDTNYCQYDLAIPFSVAGTNLLWYTSAEGGTGISTAPTPSTALGGVESWYVTQTSAEGCVSDRRKISARIWTMPYPDLSLTDKVSCIGKYMTFTLNNVGEGVDGYTWYFEPNDSIKNVNPVYHSFNNTGSFVVNVNAYYKYCRDTTLNTQVDIFPYASFDLGPDTSICKGSNAIQLSAKRFSSTGGVSWLWNTGETTQSIQIVAPGVYFVKASLHGCETTDSILVSDDCYIDIPNVFSPNGDGMNDYFFPRQLLSKGLTAFKIDIYNRWGQQVFSGNALDGRGWDGNFNGVAQPEGVYIYVIDAEFRDGQKENHKGNVTLLR